MTQGQKGHFLLRCADTVVSQKGKMGLRVDSLFLPLFLVAFQVWSHLLGESLVLSELGLGITCSPLCETEKKKNADWVIITGTNSKQAQD